MDIETAAVLVVDFQNEYRPGATYPVAGFEAVLVNAASVIEAARRAGRPVIHAQAWVEPAAERDYELLFETLDDTLRYGAAGSAGADFCNEVRPSAGEVVIRKAWPSAFSATALADTLKRMRIDHLIVTGVWTDSCVRATVFDAVFAGFRVWLVKDACGSGTDTMHRTAILDMANRLYGGGVLRSSEAVKAINGQAYSAWRCSRPVEFQYTVETIDPLYDAL